MRNQYTLLQSVLENMFPAANRDSPTVKSIIFTQEKLLLTKNHKYLCCHGFASSVLHFADASIFSKRESIQINLNNINQTRVL